MLDRLTDHYSRALQETAFLMGQAVSEAHPEIDEVKFSCPNNHHFVYDLSSAGSRTPARSSSPPTAPTA